MSQLNYRLSTTEESWTLDSENLDTDTVTGVEIPGVNLTQLGLSHYLQQHLGPRHRSASESLLLTTIYGIIFLTGVFGNICTCIVIIHNKRLHTATNYYLFSLAVSDILTLLLGLPPELYTIMEAYPWRLGRPYCLLKTFVTEMTSSASVLTIAAFTIERYLAICHSLRAQAMSGLSRAVRNILVIWLIACITALPYPIHTRTFYYLRYPGQDDPIPESLICNIPLEWINNMQYIFQVSTFLLFILPMILISVLYIQIGVALHKSEKARQLSLRVTGQARTPRTQSRKAVFKMLVAVVVAFCICWAPFHAQRLLTIYIRDEHWTPSLLELQSILFYISGILYFVSCTVNPILYNLMSLNYRQAFRSTLCYRCLDEPARFRLRYGGTSFYLPERTATMTHRANDPLVGSAPEHRHSDSSQTRAAFSRSSLSHLHRSSGFFTGTSLSTQGHRESNCLTANGRNESRNKLAQYEPIPTANKNNFLTDSNTTRRSNFFGSSPDKYCSDTDTEKSKMGVNWNNNNNNNCKNDFDR